MKMEQESGKPPILPPIESEAKTSSEKETSAENPVSMEEFNASYEEWMKTATKKLEKLKSGDRTENSWWDAYMYVSGREMWDEFKPEYWQYLFEDAEKLLAISEQLQDSEKAEKIKNNVAELKTSANKIFDIIIQRIERRNTENMVMMSEPGRFAKLYENVGNIEKANYFEKLKLKRKEMEKEEKRVIIIMKIDELQQKVDELQRQLDEI
jgi:hypothetical protein